MRPTRSFLSLVEFKTVVPDIDVARIDPRESNRADKGIVHDLESQHGKRVFVARQPDHIGAGLHVDTPDRLAVERRREKIDNGVEQRLHALILECRARTKSG